MHSVGNPALFKITYDQFPCGEAGWGSGIVTAMITVAAMAWVHSLARELPHAASVVMNKKPALSQKPKEGPVGSAVLQVLAWRRRWQQG